MFIPVIFYTLSKEIKDYGFSTVNCEYIVYIEQKGLRWWDEMSTLKMLKGQCHENSCSTIGPC